MYEGTTRVKETETQETGLCNYLILVKISPVKVPSEPQLKEPPVCGPSPSCPLIAATWTQT